MSIGENRIFQLTVLLKVILPFIILTKRYTTDWTIAFYSQETRRRKPKPIKPQQHIHDGRRTAPKISSEPLSALIAEQIYIRRDYSTKTKSKLNCTSPRKAITASAATSIEMDGIFIKA